ncbi:tetratricopeptide repeat protein [Phycisphaerae bacterium RAS1]|nr:tetratricopeptide repeat protein [Phycisphaerae bacterium RAS1]
MFRFTRFLAAALRISGCLLAASIVAAGPPQNDAQRHAATPLSEIAGAPPTASRPSASLDDVPDLRRQYERARTALEDNRIDEALRLLDAAVTSAKGDYFELIALTAQAKFRAGRHGEARTAAEFAAMFRPADPDIRFLLGELYQKQDVLDRAVEQFRTATLAEAGAPDNPRVTAAWFRLGECLEKTGRLAAAAESYARFDRVIWETSPEQRNAEPVAAILKGQANGAVERRVDLLAKLGRSAEALQALESAMQRAPGDPRLARLYAQQLLSAGRGNDAAAFATAKLAELEKRSADGAATDEPIESSPYLSVLIEAARTGGGLLVELERIAANVAAGQGTALASALARRLEASEPAASVVLFRALAAHRPQDADAAWALAGALRRAGRLEEALTSLIAFVRANPDAETTFARLDGWLAALPDVEAFLKLAARLTERADRDFATDFVLGAAAAAGGQVELAEKLLSAAAGARPGFALTLVVRAQLFVRAGRWQDARREASAALEIAPRLAAAQYTLGQALEAVDDNEAAADAYKAALKQRPEDVAYALALGRLFDRTDEPVSAQRYFEQALGVNPACGEAAQGLIDSYLFHSPQKDELARSVMARAERSDMPEDVLRRMRTTLRFSRALFSDEHAAELAAQFKQHPADVRTGNMLISALLFRHHPEEALEIARSVAGVADPNDEETAVRRAEAHALNLDYRGGTTCIQPLLERYPNRVRLLDVQCELLVRDFRFEEARPLLRHVLTLKLPDLKRELARLRLLGTYAEIGDYEPALELLDEWIKDQPDNVNYLADRLSILALAGRGKEAVEAARKRLEQDAEDPLASALFIQTCEQCKDYAALAEQARKWYEANPPLPNAARILIAALTQAGRRDEALAVLDELTPATQDDDFDCRRMRAELLAAGGKVDAAIDVLETLLQEPALQPPSDMRYGFQEKLVETLAKARQYDRALQTLDGWKAAIDPRDRVTPLVLNSFRRYVFQASERLDEYISLCEEELQRNPHDPAMNNDLGYTLIDRGEQIERATRMVRLAVAESVPRRTNYRFELPLNAAYLDSLGWACYKSGDFPAAREWLSRAVRLRDGEDAALHDHLADVEFRVGDRDAALKHWKKAVALLEAQEAEKLSTRDVRLQAQVKGKLAALERGEKPEVAPLAPPPKPGGGR